MNRRREPLRAEPITETAERPALSITAAADATGKDRRTIRRRLDRGDFPNAAQVDTPNGPAWRIPVGDILSAGLPLHAPTGPDRTDDDDGRTSGDLDGGSELVAERDEWRRRAEVAEARVEMLERIAAERAEHLADLRRVMAPLEAAAEDRRRGWFGRK